MTMSNTDNERNEIVLLLNRLETLIGANEAANVIKLPDLTTFFQDNSDATKQLQFQLSGITTATTRTLTVPNVSDTIVVLADTQTLTNKTLTSPAINTPVVTAATSPYASGSFTVATGRFMLHCRSLSLTTTQRGTLAGTARLRII